MITIVDYGMGNTGSISNMLKYIGIDSEITCEASRIDKAEKLILPGVGAFDMAMKKLEDACLLPLLHKKAIEDKIPVLGICLGMQLMTNGSEEGEKKGLGWIQADTIKFLADKSANFRVPHMGWNMVHPHQSHVLFTGFENVPRFYFVHSYYVKAYNDANVLASTRYGNDFHSVITNGQNITGVQFHPEKSHRYGMKLLKAFAISQ